MMARLEPIVIGEVNTAANFWTERERFPHDVELVVSELDSSHAKTATFKVHKVFLALRTQYFQGLFVSSAMKETTQQRVMLAIPAGTLEAFELLLEFCYNGHCTAPSLSYVLMLANLTEYLGIEDNLNLIPTSLSLDQFIAYAKQASLHPHNGSFGRRLLASSTSPARNVSDEKATLQRLEDAMDEMDSTDSGYALVGALLNLVFCLDEAESQHLLRVVAHLASPRFCTLPELLNLPLKHFALLVISIPHAEVTENVLADMVLHYVDHHSGRERPLSSDKVAKLLELIDETAVTQDFADLRLLPRLCADRRRSARLVSDASPFPYDVRCPVTMESYSSSDPPLLVCGAGHHAKVQAGPGRPRCSVCSRVPIINAVVDRAMARRLENYRARKVEINSAAKRWVDALTVSDDLLEDVGAPPQSLPKSQSESQPPLKSSRDSKKRKHTNPPTAAAVAVARAPSNTTDATHSVAAAADNDRSFVAEICYCGQEESLFLLPLLDLGCSLRELVARWAEAVNQDAAEAMTLWFETGPSREVAPLWRARTGDITLRRYIEELFPLAVSGQCVRVNLWLEAHGGQR